MRYIVRDGILAAVKEPEAVLRIPEGVRAIAAGCLRNNPALREVVFPKTLRDIGSASFRGCGRLGRVSFPEGLELVGSRAFENCSSLEEARICAPRCAVGERAFSGCAGLKRAELTVSSAAPDAFYGCANLREAYARGEPLSDGERARLGIPDPDGFLMEGPLLKAYFGADALVNIPPQTEEIGPGALRNKYELREVLFPDGLRKIGRSAFDGCASLERLLLPDSVEEIGPNAFRQCPALKEARLPSGCAVGADAFYGCRRLRREDLPGAPETLGVPDENGFLIRDGVLVNYWGDPADVDIPEGVRSIAPRALHRAFGMFDSLHDLARVRLPESARALEFMPILRGGGVRVSRPFGYLRSRLPLPEPETLRWLAAKWADASLNEWAHLALFQSGELAEAAWRSLEESPDAAARELTSLLEEEAPGYERARRFLCERAGGKTPPEAAARGAWRGYLEGDGMTYFNWARLFVKNERIAATHLGAVWEQEGVFFMARDGVMMTSAGDVAHLREDAEVRLAHVLDMPEAEARRWRIVLARAGLASFRDQMYEPKYDAPKADRYLGCRVRIADLAELSDSGIILYWEDHNEIGIELNGPMSLGSRLDLPYGKVATAKDKLILGVVEAEEIDRRSNRLLYVLDLLTAEERLARDDPALLPLLSCASPEQTERWLDLALQCGATNAAATLLQAKKELGAAGAELQI